MSEAGRLRPLPPDELDDRQRQIYEAITAGPRASGPQRFSLTNPDGTLTGPFNALLYAASVGQAMQEVGSAIRFATSLTDRARELAILVVAAHWRSEFEQHAHEAIGAAAGLSQALFDALRRNRRPQMDDPQEQLIADLTAALAAGGDLDDDQYARAVDSLGEQAVVELVLLVGYYSALALALRVFRVPVPDESMASGTGAEAA